MAGSTNSVSNFGSFVPTTNIWDIQQVQSLDIDPGLKELLVRLYQNINNISVSLNTRDAGYYTTEEFLNGQIYFPNPNLNSNTAQEPEYRQVFRKVINFGALPATTTKSVAHDIEVNPQFSFTRIYGVATTPNSSFIPLPYASPTLNQNIKINVDINNINITTGIDYSAYSTCYVILEYIKF